jgi:hypothetical protein
MSADDGGVLAPRHDGLDEAELADTPGESVELRVTDAPRVGRVGAEPVDRDLLDGQLGLGGQHDDTSPWTRSLGLATCGPWA